jgi:hypothetical protein
MTTVSVKNRTSGLRSYSNIQGRNVVLKPGEERTIDMHPHHVRQLLRASNKPEPKVLVTIAEADRAAVMAPGGNVDDSEIERDRAQQAAHKQLLADRAAEKEKRYFTDPKTVPDKEPANAPANAPAPAREQPKQHPGDPPPNTSAHALGLPPEEEPKAASHPTGSTGTPGPVADADPDKTIANAASAEQEHIAARANVEAAQDEFVIPRDAVARLAEQAQAKAPAPARVARVKRK